MVPYARSELAQRLDEEKKKAEAAAQQAQERVKVLRSAQQVVAATAQQVRARQRSRVCRQRSLPTVHSKSRAAQHCSLMSLNRARVGCSFDYRVLLL